MMLAAPGKPVYALLADGSTVLIRPAGPADLAAVRAMHEEMSPDNAYLRVLSASRLAPAQEASRVCREAGSGYAALLALSGEEIVGCGSHQRRGADNGAVG